MTKHAIIKAIDDPHDYVHARNEGTIMDKTECGLKTHSLPVDGPVTCPTCKRAIGE
jgi:predicted Zn-ribbon and HTH transcriptional regulator